MNVCLSSLHIQTLLDEPNPISPANVQATQLHQEKTGESMQKEIAIMEQTWKNCLLFFNKK